jgi:hypothetical protein
MRLVFGYDVMTYNGEQPNCLNPKFLPTIHKASDFKFDQSDAYFRQRWQSDWPVYNSNYLWEFIERKSVYEIIWDREKKGEGYEWFYVIEPFGNIEQFFGEYSDVHYQFALEFMSQKAIDEIKNWNGNVLINYIIDGGLGITKKNFQKIFDFFKKHEIPEEKIFLVFQDFKLKNNIKKLGYNYNVLDYNQALIAKSQEFFNTLNNPNFSYWGEENHEPQVGRIQPRKNTVVTYDEFEKSIGSEKKDFLFLCRHWKEHRISILYNLYKLGLDKSLVSWDNKFYNENFIRNHINRWNDEEFISLIRNESKHLDIDDLTKIAGYGFEDKNIYLNSYLSIVTESIFFQIRENINNEPESEFPTGYLSEKIWKPIGHCQPFILVGPAKSLEYIKSLGFKTFSPFIDESYDNYIDDDKRLHLISEEIIRFAEKTKEEKDEFLNNVKEICEHNQRLFLDFSVNHKRIQGNIVSFLLKNTNNII